MVMQFMEKNTEEDRVSTFVSLGIINTIKYLGWVLIPTFLLFIPIGVILLFQKKRLHNFNNNFIWNYNVNSSVLRIWQRNRRNKISVHVISNFMYNIIINN